MLDELELLKLGGIENNINFSLGGKNLSFLNLDFLNFEGKYYDSMEKNIFFLSCRNWKINKSELHFFNFHSSNLEGMFIEDSNIDAWNIDYCDGYDVKVSNSVFTRCKIKSGGFLPYLDNVDLRDSCIDENYMRDNNYGYEPNIELLRRFKKGFLFRGQNDLAGRYYYWEKCIQRKNDFKEVIFHLKRFFVPRDLFNRKVFRPILILHHLKNFFKYLKDYLLGFISWIWWGYGEKPSRIIFISMLFNCYRYDIY